MYFFSIGRKKERQRKYFERFPSFFVLKRKRKKKKTEPINCNRKKQIQFMCISCISSMFHHLLYLFNHFLMTSDVTIFIKTKILYVAYTQNNYHIHLCFIKTKILYVSLHYSKFIVLRLNVVLFYNNQYGHLCQTRSKTSGFYIDFFFCFVKGILIYLFIIITIVILVL